VFDVKCNSKVIYDSLITPYNTIILSLTAMVANFAEQGVENMLKD